MLQEYRREHQTQQWWIKLRKNKNKKSLIKYLGVLMFKLKGEIEEKNK